MKPSTSIILVVLAACSIVAVIAASKISEQEHLVKVQLDRERQQTLVAYLVCDYLLANTNQWPGDWEALEPHFVVRYQESSPWKFEELKNSVELDFNIDGPSLAGVSINPKKSNSFLAIRSKSGPCEYLGTNPNQIVLSHFRAMICY